MEVGQGGPQESPKKIATEDLIELAEQGLAEFGDGSPEMRGRRIKSHTIFRFGNAMTAFGRTI